jgi:hypothetical protein
MIGDGSVPSLNYTKERRPPEGLTVTHGSLVPHVELSSGLYKGSKYTFSSNLLDRLL